MSGRRMIARVSATGAFMLAVTLLAASASGQCYGVWAQAELGYQADAAMTYDSLRQTVVLHCGARGAGASGGTWSWDGLKWSRLAWSGPWPLRTLASIVYDPARDRFVLFGGRSTATGLPFLRDTWEFDGSAWRLVASDGPPAQSSTGKLVYHAGRGKVVFYDTAAASTLWEWDGVRWTVVPATGSPPGGAIAYDSMRDRIVLVSTATPSTWAFDGSAWTSLSSNPFVSLIEATVTYDSARDRVQVFGNGFTCTEYFQEFDGTSWTTRPLHTGVTTFPTAMTYDTASQTSVVFSSRGPTSLQCGQSAPSYYNSTWEFNGSVWQAWPDLRPHWVDSASATYDQALGQTVVLPGSFNSCGLEMCFETYPGGTWTWNAAGWQYIAPASSPLERRNAGLVYDSGRGRAVLFGGAYWHYIGYESTLSDTDFYTGAWTTSPGNSPGAIGYHAMSYDPVRDRTVALVPGPQTWELNDTTWSQITPSGSSPASRTYGVMAYDPNTSKALLFGGRVGSTNKNDTWTWDGVSWTQLSPAGTIPGARYGHTMATDTDRSVVLMTGGTGTGSGETWEWSGTQWTKVGDGGPTVISKGAAAYDSGAGVMNVYVFDAMWQWVPAQAPVFVEDPGEAITTVGNPAIMGCLTESVGPVTFQWRKDGAPLVDDGRIRGSHTMRLVIEQATLDDTGSYDVVCTGGCGAVTSQAATLTVYCPADFDQNGFVNGDDFDTFSFLFYWGAPGADFDGNGFVNGDDFDVFSLYFEGGC